MVAELRHTCPLTIMKKTKQRKMLNSGLFSKIIRKDRHGYKSSTTPPYNRYLGVMRYGALTSRLSGYL